MCMCAYVQVYVYVGMRGGVCVTLRVCIGVQVRVRTS